MIHLLFQCSIAETISTEVILPKQFISINNNKENEEKDHNNSQQYIGRRKIQNNQRKLLDTEIIEKKNEEIKTIDQLVAAAAADDDDENNTPIRTATGGFIYTLMIILTGFAFVGNAAFLVYVFWLSK
jgi:hypothetical protein